MTYKRTQAGQRELGGDEVMVVVKSIPMEKWEQRSFLGNMENFHAYHTISGDEVHVEISRKHSKTAGEKHQDRHEAEVWVCGYPVGKSRSKAINDTCDSIVQWKNERNERFVELLRVNREKAQTEAVKGIREYLASRK